MCSVDVWDVGPHPASDDNNLPPGGKADSGATGGGRGGGGNFQMLYVAAVAAWQNSFQVSGMAAGAQQKEWALIDDLSVPPWLKRCVGYMRQREEYAM